MAGKGKKWLIGCGAGCGLFIVLNIVFFAATTVMLTRPMNKAVGSQETLIETLGEPQDFQPGLDILAPDRLAAFLRVREALEDHCLEVTRVAEGFEAMEALDDGEEPSTGDILKGLGRVMGSVKGMVHELGAVLETRNNALLAEDMNLGEYTWIYILSYYSYLGYTPETGVDDDGGSLDGREQRLMEGFMRAHATALLQAGRDREAEDWNLAADRLDWEDTGVPFAGGELPGEVTGALEPYRRRLADSFCAPLAEMDLGRIEKKGLSFHAN